jgi:dTDP-glucose 4,6-dehydratase
MKILVTGGCGFAGHHLIEHLLANTDAEIYILDSLTYAGKVDRVLDISNYNPSRVGVMWHDLRAPLFPVADKLSGITHVLHLAAESHVDRSISDPAPFIHNNVIGSLNLYEWARNHDQLEHFVQISTDEVYGAAPAGHAHQEWLDPMLPSNPYAASKVGQEAIGISYWRTYGLPLTITNTMNLFGERQHPEKFLPKTIRAIANGDPVELHGKYHGIVDGLPDWEPSSRHWLHARNHADALLWILTNTRPYQYGDSNVLPNVPNRWHVAGEEKSVYEMACMVTDILNTAFELVWVDYHSTRPGHDHRYALDNSKILSAGWKPPYNLQTALEKTVAWVTHDSNKRWLNDY